MATTPTSQPRNIVSHTVLPVQVAGTQTAQIIPVVPKKGLQLWTRKPEVNKIERPSEEKPVKNDVDDKEDMILELSDLSLIHI